MANQPYSERERLIWRIRARNPEQERRLADAVGVSPVTAALLANRGIVSPEQAKAYFSPSIGQLCDPFTLPDMPEAVRLLNSAIDNRRAVLVHGDYDVDGLTATALLVRFISKLGLDVKYFIPHRIYDHYGLSSRVMEEAAQGGVSVVIAVDCGVRDFEAVNRARELGMSVIVLDHHEPGERLPRAAAIVDPKLPHSIYPNRELTSAGLALQLARAVAQSRNIPVEYVERAFIDLAAIGTIADVAPLRDENRALTAVGLRQLGRTQKIGLRTLMNLCRINGTPKAEHVAFRLAPRMNAPGRLADPNPALTLLLTTDQDEANRVALYLDSLNRQRQKEQSAICDEARILVERDLDLDTMPVIVLASESWHVGVVGIAASQIVAMFGRPTLLLAVEGDYLRGSGRSIPEFHLAAALDRCADILERYGGHAMAVGATLKRTCFEAFRDRLNEVARQYIDPQQLRPFVEIDAQVSLTEVTAELVAEFEQMEPFGSGNPAPLLAIMGVRIVDQTLVGRDGQHLKLWVTDERYTCECIGFGMAREAERLKKASRVDLCFVPQTDTYDGSRKLQLCLQAVRPSS